MLEALSLRIFPGGVLSRINSVLIRDTERRDTKGDEKAM